MVKEGTFTLYDGDDRRCPPDPYGPGQAFVNQGGGHLHIGRNETDLPVKLLVTFIVFTATPSATWASMDARAETS
jgi:hypothetical protein